MVARRKTDREPVGEEGDGNEGGDDASIGYEQSREKRIRENMERMEKLGILDLSKKLKQKKPSVKRTQNSVSGSEPSRRSSRLEGVARVSYVDIRPKREKTESSKNVEINIPIGTHPEIYTEEDLKLLGDSNSSWTVGVDGYDEEGTRVYDQVDGETCHQCRQKTLGHHTHCCKCKIVQGQLCGDCLYTRYGEHVLEVAENPNWVCPGCRGICNCSRCRLSKGWKPTGAIYRKVAILGFKSVAHYLLQTRQSSNISENQNAAEDLLLAEIPMPSNNDAPGMAEGSDDNDIDYREDNEIDVQSSDSSNPDSDGSA